MVRSLVCAARPRHPPHCDLGNVKSQWQAAMGATAIARCAAPHAAARPRPGLARQTLARGTGALQHARHPAAAAQRDLGLSLLHDALGHPAPGNVDHIEDLAAARHSPNGIPLNPRAHRIKEVFWQ